MIPESVTRLRMFGRPLTLSVQRARATMDDFILKNKKIGIEEGEVERERPRRWMELLQ